jgi:hypothetical protein
MYERWVRPVARVIPISHVRVLEKWPSCAAARISTASSRVADSPSSENTNPRSPAKSQQPAWSGISVLDAPPLKRISSSAKLKSMRRTTKLRRSSVPGRHQSGHQPEAVHEKGEQDHLHRSPVPVLGGASRTQTTPASTARVRRRGSASSRGLSTRRATRSSQTGMAGIYTARPSRRRVRACRGVRRALSVRRAERGKSSPAIT